MSQEEQWSATQLFGQIKVVWTQDCKIHFGEQFCSGQENGTGELIGLFHLHVLLQYGCLKQICVFNLRLMSLRKLL